LPACECPTWVAVADLDDVARCVLCGKMAKREISQGQLEAALRERDRDLPIR
jgi:hypothetical protein